MSTDELKLKTVAVLGGSCGGNRVAQVLAAGLPSGWRVVLIERNSHYNHVYNLPRYAVLPGHEHKAFIPYDNLFKNQSIPSPHPHKRVHGTVTSLHPHHVTYIPHAESGPAVSTSETTNIETTEEEILYFDYAVYALGSHLPSPIDLWESCIAEPSPIEAQKLLCSALERGLRSATHTHPYMGTKKESISALCSRQQRIEAAQRVLVVGGGALGIQFASDIAAVYPRKSVTLLHSRSKLLPRFDEALGDEALQGLQELGVDVIFGDRLDMSSLNGTRTKGYGNQEMMLIKTTNRREIEADLVLLCTGQTPNTSLVHTMDSRTVDPKSGMVRVSCTMQILALEEQGTAVNQGNLNGIVHSTLPTLCGTSSPSLVDTPAKPDLTPLTPMSPSASTIETFVESGVDASHDPHTFAYPHLFAIGDAADAFGAVKAGHTAYYQGEVAARNVIRLIKGAEALEEYIPGPAMIKVSLGLTKSAYEVAGVVGTKDDGTDDLGAAIIWRTFGYKDIDEEGMWV